MRFAKLPLPDGEIDLIAGKVRRGTQFSELTPNEVRFLAYLAAHPGVFIPLEELHQKVWEFSPKVQTRAVYFAVRKLRSQIEPNPKIPTLLLGTERLGFALQPLSKRISILGRDSELTYLQKHLEVPGTILLLHGPGGVGKSKLLQELSLSLGILLIDAKDIQDEQVLAVAIAQALKRNVGHSPVLLVERVLTAYPGIAIAIDHADELSSAAQKALSHWQQQTPKLCWLIASRSPLPLPTVNLLRIQPLNMDDAKQLFHQLCPAEILASQGEELSELLTYLDGLPLAIEIAAWQAQTLPLRRIRDLLLDTSTRTLEAPIGSLERTIALSWNRLSSLEQLAVARLCSVAAAVPLDAALAIMGIHEQELFRLVEQGLLRIDASQKEILYAPFHTVRWYFHLQRYPSDGCERLATWWIDTIEGSPEEVSPSSVGTHEALLQTALSLINKGNATLGAPLALSCLEHGRNYEATPLHKTLITQARKLALDPLVQARLEWRIARWQNSIPELMMSYRQLQSLVPAREFVEASLHLATACSTRGYLPGVEEALANARIASPSTDREYMSRIEVRAAYLARAYGDYPAAMLAAKRAVAQSDPSSMSSIRAFHLLISIYLDQARYDEALVLSQTMLEGAQHLNPRALVTAWYTHGIASRLIGQYDNARIAFFRAIEILSLLANKSGATFINTHINLALIDMDENQPEPAYRRLLDILPFAMQNSLNSPFLQTLLELLRLQCGHPPAPFSMDAMLADLQLQSIADEVVYLSLCTEIAYRSGVKSQGDEYLLKMREKIEKVGLSPNSEAGRCFTRVCAIAAQLYPIQNLD